jgi:probable rRNA maturation factor
MELNFFDEVKSGFQDRDFLFVANKVIDKKDSILSVSLISEEKMKKLNRDYRGKDSLTDVLSFESDDEKELGDIFICFEVAKEQAKNKGIEIKDEVRFLFCHGVLHLLGYNHKEEEEWYKEEGEKRGKEMWEKMNQCLT